MTVLQNSTSLSRTNDVECHTRPVSYVYEVKEYVFVELYELVKQWISNNI